MTKEFIMKHINRMEVKNLKRNYNLSFKIEDEFAITKIHKDASRVATKDECCVCYNDTNSFNGCPQKNENNFKELH
jgi:hypothetical protein